MTDDLELRDFGIHEFELDHELQGELDQAMRADSTQPLAPGEFPQAGRPAFALPPDLIPGSVTAPPGYRLLDQLGEGGMGVVYAALQLTLDRIVAIKFLREGLLGVAAEDQFFGEARSMARLRHPNVVQVYDAGSVDGRPFLVMDRVEGRSVLELVEQEGSELSIRHSFQLMAEACRGVDYCNRQGLVHCDINPRNIMIGDDWQPFVMDFGIARALGTVTCDSVRDYGTPAYLAPERLRNGAVIDARTDVYSIGAVLYFMVTGRHPFKGRNARVILRKVLDKSPAMPREINPRLSLDAETIIQKAMEKDPVSRYSTVEELREEIGRYLNGEAIAARRLSWSRRFLRFLGRHRAAVAIVCIALAGFAGAGVYTLSLVERTRELEERNRRLDEQFDKLKLTYSAALSKSETDAEGLEQKITTLEGEVQRRLGEVNQLRGDYDAQGLRLRELLRQKDELLSEREALLTRREDANRLAEEKLGKLASSDAQAQAITTELETAREQLARQDVELDRREKQLKEQAALVDATMQQKREALSQAEHMIEQEIEKETATLLAMLEDDSWRTRVIALDKLGRRADTRTLGRIVAAATRDSRRDHANTVEVQTAAIAAMGHFPEQGSLAAAYDALMRDALPQVRLAALRELSRQLEESEVKQVERLVDDADVDVAVAAVDTLAKNKRRECAGRIALLLGRDGQPRAQIAAAEALAGLAPGNEGFGRRLLPLLDLPDETVRAASAAALAVFPMRGVAKALERLTDDESLRVRHNGVSALEAIARGKDITAEVRNRALESLVAFLLDSSRNLAETADQALRRATGKDAAWRYAADINERKANQRRWTVELHR